MGEGGQKVLTPSYKISHREVTYNMMTVVNNVELCI